MYKIIILITLTALVSLTGCFKASDEEQIKTAVQVYYEPITKGDVNLLFVDKNSAQKSKSLTILGNCIGKRSDAANTELLFNLDAKKMARYEALKIDSRHIPYDISVKCFDNMEKSSGNKEKFQTALSDFKEKSKKYLDPTNAKILFEGEMLNCDSMQNYQHAMRVNIVMEEVINPIRLQYPDLTKQCVQEVTDNVPMTSISKIILAENKESAKVEVLLKNTKTKTLKLLKVNENWVVQ